MAKKPTSKANKPARAVCERPIRKRAAKPMTLATLMASPELTLEERTEMQEFYEFCRWLKGMSPAQYKVVQDMLHDAQRMLASGVSDLEIAAHLEHYYGAV